jgi:hypothetical protein
MRFVKTLDKLDEASRSHLLRLENSAELTILFYLALTNGYRDVAAAVEVEANNRGEY